MCSEGRSVHSPYHHLGARDQVARSVEKLVSMRWLAAPTGPAIVGGQGCRSPASQRRTEVTMQQLFFSQLDESKAVAFLQRWPQKRFRDGVNTWGNTEWRVFGCPSQLEFSAQSLPDGVRITYYLSEEARRKQGLAGLTPDGSFELRVDMQARWLGVVPAGPAIVTSREAGRESKAKYERILWQRLVLDFTKLGARELGAAR